MPPTTTKKTRTNRANDVYLARRATRQPCRSVGRRLEWRTAAIDRRTGRALLDSKGSSASSVHVRLKLNSASLREDSVVNRCSEPVGDGETATHACRARQWPDRRTDKRTDRWAQTRKYRHGYSNRSQHIASRLNWWLNAYKWFDSSSIANESHSVVKSYTSFGFKILKMISAQIIHFTSRLVSTFSLVQ